jgi:hypothetical protein
MKNEIASHEIPAGHGARAGILPAGTAAAFYLLQKDTALLVPFS